MEGTASDTLWSQPGGTRCLGIPARCPARCLQGSYSNFVYPKVSKLPWCWREGIDRYLTGIDGRVHLGKCPDRRYLTGILRPQEEFPSQCASAVPWSKGSFEDTPPGNRGNFRVSRCCATDRQFSEAQVWRDNPGCHPEVGLHPGNGSGSSVKILGSAMGPCCSAVQRS